MDSEQLAAAATPLAASIAAILIGTAPEGVPAEVQVSNTSWLDTPGVLSREQVWIAIGMINVTLRLDADDALALLRAHAYASDQTLDEVVNAVINRRIDLASLSVGSTSNPGPDTQG